eukprot:8909-Heterococcus_DN1.PRE.1
MSSMMYIDATVYALLPRKDDLLNGSVRCSVDTLILRDAKHNAPKQELYYMYSSRPVAKEGKHMIVNHYVHGCYLLKVDDENMSVSGPSLSMVLNTVIEPEY